MRQVSMMIAYAILALVIVGGGYLAFKGVLNIQRSLASRHWPTTSAQVVSSETSRDVAQSSRGRTYSVTFNTRTVAVYHVDGHEYTTDLEYFGQTLGSGDASEAAVKRFRYPEGKAVSVSYNPSSPGVAALRPGLHGDAFWLLGAGLAFLLPAALCLLIVSRMFAPIADAEDDPFAQQIKQEMEDELRGIHRAQVEIPISAPPRDKTMAIAAGCMGAVFCCLGLLALTAGIQRYWAGNASLSWPTTPGTIVAANKIDSDDESGLDEGTDSAWYARFVYRYTVNGVDHFNNRRRFAGVEGGGGGAEISRLREAYKNGASVKVSYSPADPDVAVLEPGNTNDSYWIPGIGVALLLFSAAIFIFIVPSVLRG